MTAICLTGKRTLQNLNCLIGWLAEALAGFGPPAIARPIVVDY